MWSVYNTTTTTTAAVLQPLYTSTCVSRHLQLRTGGHFVGSKFYCPHAFADGKSRTLIGSHILQVAGYHRRAIPMTRNDGSYILYSAMQLLFAFRSYFLLKTLHSLCCFKLSMCLWLCVCLFVCRVKYAAMLSLQPVIYSFQWK